MSIERIKASTFRSRGCLLLMLPGVPATFVLSGTALAQGPEEMHVTGIVRDFPASHADFDVAPAGGPGHFARNVELTLGADERPVLSPLGFRVDVEWTDMTGRTIAPHMYMVNTSDSGGEPLPNILTNGRLRTRNSSQIDSYDSTLGSYGPGNMGANALVATQSTAPDMIVVDNSSMISGDVLIGPGGDPDIVVDEGNGAGGITGSIGWLDALIEFPDVTIPTDMPAYSATDLDFAVGSNETLSGDHHVDLVNIRRNATVTISGDVRVVCEDRFLVAKDATLTISGDVRVVCEDRFLVAKDATLIVPDGSSLTVWCKTQMRLYGPGSVVNPDTANPDKVQIYILGSDFYNDQLVINGAASGVASMLCGRVIAPTNVLDLDQSAEFYGTFWGTGVELNNTSSMHVDLRSYETSGGCVVVDDVAGVEGGAGSGSITSAATYSDWYRDVLGVNQSKAHSITLTRDAEGVYEYLESGFFPIDDQLLGNEGEVHNQNFTYSIEAEFTYEACTGQFVSFQGGDGTWMFIDRQLVLDLGGVMPVGEQVIELDRLELVDGETYRLHLFHSNRNDMSAVFRLRTNVQLNTDGVLPSFLALYD